MKKSIQKLIQKYKNQCDFIEVRLETRENETIGVRNQNLSSASKLFDNGGCVRVFREGRCGFVTFTDFNGVENAMKRALELADFGPKSDFTIASVPAVQDEVCIEKNQTSLSIPFDKKIEILRGYTAQIEKHGSPVIMGQASYTHLFRTVHLMTSEGTDIKQELFYVQGGVLATAARDGQAEFGHVVIKSRSGIEELTGLTEKVEKACSLAVSLLDAPSVKGGNYTVITNPLLTGVFVHEAFGHMAEADNFANNKDLAEILKPGTVLGSGGLNIYDSGVIPGEMGTMKYDDEGVKTEKTYLVKNGIITGKLHSRITAARLNEQVTGNARAYSYKYAPIPRMRTTAIEKGTDTLDDMMKDIKEGILMIDAKGGHGGELFTFTSHHGFMIRDGKKAELVKGATLSGNLFKTMKNIDKFSDTEEFAAGGCGKAGQFPLFVGQGGPYIRIHDIQVGGGAV